VAALVVDEGVAIVIADRSCAPVMRAAHRWVVPAAVAGVLAGDVARSVMLSIAWTVPT
jgi:hypothetical protein